MSVPKVLLGVAQLVSISRFLCWNLSIHRDPSMSMSCFISGQKSDFRICGKTNVILQSQYALCRSSLVSDKIPEPTLGFYQEKLVWVKHRER